MGNNVIYNKQKLARIFSFGNLPHVGTSSPTDIDVPPVPFCIEIGSLKRYMIGDFKECGKSLEFGQQVLIERHCHAFTLLGYKAIGFVAEHIDIGDIVDAANTIVSLLYSKNGGWGWKRLDRETTLRELYVRFFEVKEGE